MASFVRAWQDGADIIELDVRLSADQEVVVIHDARVDRTTDGTGYVSQMTVAELKKLDAGSWFDLRYAGERIPTLSEVLDWTKGKIGLLLELKFEPFGSYDPALAPRILEAVELADIDDQIAMISYQPRALVQVKAQAPHIPAGPMRARDGVLQVGVGLARRFSLLRHSRILTPLLLRPLRYTQAWGCDVVAPNIDLATEALVEAAHRVDCPVSCGGLLWDYPAAIRMGVDTISSNNPGLVRSLYLR